MNPIQTNYSQNQPVSNVANKKVASSSTDNSENTANSSTQGEVGSFAQRRENEIPASKNYQKALSGIIGIGEKIDLIA
jgi:hypothetical protein